MAIHIVDRRIQYKTITILALAGWPGFQIGKDEPFDHCIDLQGRQAGEGFGLGVRVITDSAARGTWLSEGSFGWSGVYGTHFWADPKENLVGIVLAQTSSRTFLSDFENAVMQALVD